MKTPMRRLEENGAQKRVRRSRVGSLAGETAGRNVAREGVEDLGADSNPNGGSPVCSR